MSDFTTSNLRGTSETIANAERYIIQLEYRLLKYEGKTKEEAYQILSKKHHRSIGSIDYIIYPRK